MPSSDSRGPPPNDPYGRPPPYDRGDYGPAGSNPRPSLICGYDLGPRDPWINEGVGNLKNGDQHLRDSSDSGEMDAARTPLSEAEFEEIMNRNRAISSSAISRAVSDASAADYGSAIETLVTAISLIKQSKVSVDDRCKVLISSLQDCLHGIESKSYGSASSRRERSRERDHSRSREKSRRHKSRSRDRHEDYYREADRRGTGTASHTGPLQGRSSFTHPPICLSVCLRTEGLASGLHLCVRPNSSRVKQNLQSCYCKPDELHHKVSDSSSTSRRQRFVDSKLFGRPSVDVSAFHVSPQLYKPTTDFLRTGPCMRTPLPQYNSLHDPHLRHYFHQRDRHHRLREGNFITDDNEVICSLKDYNSYEEYLKNLKMVADQTYDDKQRAKMEKVMALQQKGRFPKDVSLAEVIDMILEEDSKNLRHALQSEAAGRQKPSEVEDDQKRFEEDLFTELDLLSWKAEDRSRLMLYEKQYRHQQNRERFLKEVQLQKDRSKQAMVERKCSNNQRKLQEKIVEAESRKWDTQGQDENVSLPSVSGESQGPPLKRQSVERPVLRSGPATVYGVTCQKLPTIQWKGAKSQRKAADKVQISQESVIEKWKAQVQNKSVGDPSLRPRTDRRALRSGPAGVCGVCDAPEVDAPEAS
ncbi:hypothetical protein AAFF_G00061090 [Aldrovandia affinis]|uniref:CPSF6/7 RSLD domain-containing protein n=1 Tax=Aldrovandia affinis TaxID=143900 RepID=A0AAD7WDV2_9TELE|nr:hypothetical protein AAFF_G00061090 [Aldrovandia affinis]